MRKPIRFRYKRYYHRRLISQRLKHFLGCALLLLCLAYASKDTFYFNNGSGGANWKIGKPQVTIWTAGYPRSLPELRAFALELINRDRQINGLPALVEDPLLSQSAQRHAEDMKNRHYYAHITPEGRTPTDRFTALGGQGGVGENIMLQSNSAGKVSILNWGLIENFQKGWMYSNGHRANLLNSERMFEK